MSKLSQKREELMKRLEEYIGHDEGCSEIDTLTKKCDCGFKEYKNFLSSSFDKLIATVVEMAEGMKDNSLSKAVQESEGAIIPTDVEIAGEICWNKALSSLTKELTEKQ